jgi:glycosyltransferase involved in cell wall biosynthesis
MSTARPRIAVIVQRYGPGVAGGAEAVAQRVVQRMSRQRWDIEVLTTCALDYNSWRDHFPPGIEIQDEHLRVRRFPVVQPRDSTTFDPWCGRIEHAAHRLSLSEADAWMQAQGPDSPALTAWVARMGQGYDAVLAFTYLYATSYHGLRAAPAGRRLLVPFAHDEWPLRLPLWPTWFAGLDRLAYSTPEEQELLEARFPSLRGRGTVIGQGFDMQPSGVAERFRRRYGLHRDLLLYLGRIDRNKGVDELVAQHAVWRQRDAWAPDLVLIGHDALGLTPTPGCHILGFVDEQTRADALAACCALINPSRLESLSLVLLEAWSAGRPTICHADCAVTVGQSRRSGGGLWYGDLSSLRAAWDILRTQAWDMARATSWVSHTYAWDAVEDRYAELVQPDRSSTSGQALA